MDALRVVAVDDEPLALRRVELLLGAWPDVTLVGKARSATTAASLIAEVRPNLVLLDIKLGAENGFDLLRRLPEDDPPGVVFVTAYDHFAAKAFDQNAIDYVLKPLRAERLRLALDKALRDLETAAAGRQLAHLRAVIGQLEGEKAGTLARSAIWVERRGERLRVPLAAIDLVEAEGDYVRISTQGTSYLQRKTLGALEAEFGADFMRISRSMLVRRDRIVAISRTGDRSYQVRLESGQALRVARSQASAVRDMLSHFGFDAR